MIDLTPYSILTVTVVTSIFIILFIIITKPEIVVSKLPMWLPVTLAAVMGLRLLFPVEFLFASDTLLSFDVFPHIDDVFHTDILVINDIVPNFNIKIVNIFCIIWITGAILFVMNYIKKYNNICRAVRVVKPTEDALILKVLNELKAEYNFSFDVKVIVSKGISSPSEFGFFRQIVFLNDYNYTENELRYILAHELTHFYNKSNWIKFFMDMVKFMLWWNPAVHLLQKHVDDLLEIYVDSYVVGKKNFEFKVGYLECLKCVFENSGTPEKTTAQMGFVHSMTTPKAKHILLKRFKVIEDGHKNNISVCVLILSLMFLYIFISGVYVVQPGYEPPIEDFLYTPEFMEENSYIVKEGDMYVLYYNGESYLRNPNLEELPKVPIINK